jgi:hypothetical protein
LPRHEREHRAGGTAALRQRLGTLVRQGGVN